MPTTCSERMQCLLVRISMWQSRKHQHPFLEAGVAKASIGYPASIGHNDEAVRVPEGEIRTQTPAALTL